MVSTKKLYRSSEDRKLTGLCGGLAEYFNIDATLLRLGMIILIIGSGVFPGLVGYIIAAIITPIKGESQNGKA